MSTPPRFKVRNRSKITAVIASVSLLSTTFPVPVFASSVLLPDAAASAVYPLTDEQYSALPNATSPDISSALYDSETVTLDARNNSISVTGTSDTPENENGNDEKKAEVSEYSLLSAPEIDMSDIDALRSAADIASETSDANTVSAGNTNIESLSINWITEDSWIDFDDNMLSQRWTDDGNKNIRYEVNFALSGEKNYEPGEIQLTVPKNVAYKRNGTTPAGSLSLAVPATPDNRATFAYTDLGEYYLIANTRRLSAATSAHFEFSIKDIVPHEINGNPNEYKTRPLSAHLSVIGENDTAVERESETLHACFDTRERVSSAFDRHEKLALSYPSSFPSALRPDNDSDYIYLSFYSYASPSGNQTFTSSFECSLGNVPKGTIVLGTSVSGTIYHPDSDGKVRYSYANGEESYEASGRTLGYATTYIACPKSSVPDGGHYIFEHTVKCTLTSTDDNETTTATATAQKQYSPIEFTAPIGHFSIKKTGGYWYNNALNKMRNGEDALAKFTVENTAFGAPWTWDDLNGNSKMEENELGYRSYSTESDDIQTQFDHQKTDMTSDEFEFAYLEFPSLSMFDYKKAEETTSGYIAINGNGSVGVAPGTITGGEYGYLPKNGNLDIDVYAQLDNQSTWIFVGTAQWRNGKLNSISAQNAASVDGGKLMLPPNTTDYRTVAQTTDAGYIYKVSPTVRLKADNENNISRIEDLFKNSDTPSTVIYNRAEIRAYEQVHPTTPLMYMEWGAQDYLEGASLFVRPEKTTTYQNDRSYRRVEMTNTLKVTEQSNLNTRSDYDEAVQKKYILQETSGTFYDLLPIGVEPDMDTIKLREGDTILSKQLVRNWRDSRHSMMIVEAKLSPVVNLGGTVAGKSGYRDVPYMTYKSYMSWESVKEVGNNVENVFAFKSGNPILGTVKGYKGEPDDPTFGNNNTSATATANVVPLISGLSADEEKTPSTVYARSNISLSVDMYSITSLSKDVSVDNTRWDAGIDEENPQNAYENGPYTYRLHMENDTGSKSKNIVIYDKIESYIPNDSDPDFEDERWHGTLVGIDTSAIEATGASPVVYYSTNPNIVVDDDSDRSGNDLTNTANWSATPPEDLSLVSAIAIDVRKSGDGQDFVLSDDSALSAYIYMQAPDLSGVDVDTKAKMYDTVLSENESESGLSGGAHAYNNAVMLATTMANDGTESEYKMVRKDYTKVGLIPFTVELSKEFDDDDNRDRIRPAQVIMHVTANGERMSVNDSEDIVLSDANNWKMSFDALRYSPDGKEISYAVQEESVPGYELSYYGTIDNGALNLQARNYHEPARWSATFDKEWEENGNQHPKTITVGICANGVRTDTITLRETDGWVSDQRLYKYDKGNEIAYTFEEDYVPGYAEPKITVGTEEDAMHVQLINTYHPYGELSIEKQISDATEASRNSVFKVTPTIYRSDTGEPDSGAYEWENTNGERGTFENGDVLDIKGGETITIKNIPSENTYDVIEENPNGWNMLASQSTGLSGSIKAGRTATAEIHNQYESIGTGKIDVQKTLSNHDLFPRMFRFELLDSEMSIMFTGTNAGDGTVNMPTQKFSNEDDGKTFTYYVREIKQEREGYIYDESVWKVEMIPHDQGDGTIEVETRYYKNDNIEALDKVVFENEYKASGEISLKGWKTLSGGDLKDNMFSFVLEDENGNEVSQGTNTAEGEILFAPFRYDESDIGKTYTYTAREIASSIPEIETKCAFTPNMENGDKTTRYENSMEDRKTISFDGAVQLQISIEYSTEANYDVVEIYPGSGGDALKNLSGSGSEEFTVDDSSVEFYFHSDGSVIKGFGYYAEITPIYKDLHVNYDDAQFTYTVEVVDNGNGTLSFNTNVDENPIFKNSMKPGELTVHKFVDKEADRSIEHNFKVQFTGEDIPDGEWEFTREESSGEKIAFAIYSEADKGLRFYKRSKNDWPVEGQEYHGYIADKIYWNVEDIVAPQENTFASAQQEVPWLENQILIVDFIDIVTPKYSTSWWFAGEWGSDNFSPYIGVCCNDGEDQVMGLLDLANLDTSRVTNMSYMFNNCSQGFYSFDPVSYDFIPVTASIPIECNFDVSSVKTMEGMFQGSTISLYTFDWDVSQVSNMDKMFYNFGFNDWYDMPEKLEITFNNINVTSMAYMFSGSSATTIECNFDTSNITDMSYMFYCSSIVNFDMSSLDTSNVTDMSKMFSGCSQLTDLNISNSNIANVTDTSYMFASCSSLTKLDFLREWDISNVVNIEGMFQYSSISDVDLSIISNWNTSNVRNMSKLFNNCTNLITINTALSQWDTSNVTDMSDMFQNCSSLVSLDLSSFNTSNVTNMSYMFAYCSSLVNLDMSGFDTNSVTNMNNMFAGCSSLTSPNVNMFDTSNVTNMNSMFYNCYSLTTLDLSSFDTSKVTNMKDMFRTAYGSSSTPMSLTTVFVSDLWATDNVVNSSDLFTGCTSLVGGAGTAYYSTHTDKTYARIDDPDNGQPGYFTYKAAPSNTLSTMSLNASVSSPVPSDNTRANEILPQSLLTYGDPFETLSATSERDVLTAPLSNFSDENAVTTAAADGENIVPWTTFGTCEWMIDADGNMTIRPIDGVSGELPSNTRTFNESIFWPWREYSSDIKTVNFQGKIYGGTSVNRIFYDFSSITSLDLNGFDTSNVVDMKYMFCSCDSLLNLNLSGFDTSNVTNMYGMFSSCPLITLDLHSFDTSNVTNMERMFAQCSSLTSLNLSGWNTCNVTNMNSMFWGCTALPTLDLSSFDTRNVSDMYNMFGGCSVFTTLNLSSFDTSNVTNMYSMFDSCYALSNLDLSNFDTNNVTSMAMMFFGCSSLENINMSNFDTRNVTDMSNMFYGCSSLKSLDISSFNTGNVTDMSFMFSRCSSLLSLDLSNFNTNNVIDMQDMFQLCSSLASLDISSFDTGNVTKMREMFYACNKLNYIKLSSSFRVPNNNRPTFPIPDSQYVDYPITGKWISYDAQQGGPYTPDELTAALVATGSDASIYAGTWQWEEAIPKYTISYDLNGASGAMANTEHIIGEPVTLARPNAYYLGYVEFIEWNTAPDGSGTAYPAEIALNEDLAGDGETLTLYAMWDKDDSPVTIKDNILSFTLHGNESITFPNIPAGVGYTVWEETTAGWICVESSGENGIIVPEEVSEAFFANEYHPDRTQATITGTKTLNGEPASGFEFSISENGTKIAQVSSSISGMFSHTIVYDEPGEHDYTVSEVIGEDGNMNYDKRIFTAHVSVTDNGEGALSASVSYPQGNPSFENTMKPGAISIVKRITNGENIPAEVMGNTTFDAVVTLDYGQGNIETREVVLCADGTPTIIDDVPAGTAYSVEEVNIPSYYMFDAESSENISGIVKSGGTVDVKISNRYFARGEAIVNVKKELIGGSLSGNEFSFVVRDEDGNIIDRMTNDDNGNASLLISASTDDEGYAQSMKYFISEDESVFPAKWNGALGMDARIVPITVTWNDNGLGRLIADVDYGSFETDGSASEEAKFINKLSTGLIEISKEVVGGTSATDNKVFSFSVALADENGEKVEPSAWWIKGDASKANGDGESVYGEDNSDDVNGSKNDPNLYDTGIAYIRSGQTLVLEVPHNTTYSISEQAIPEGFELVSSADTEGEVRHGVNAHASFVNSYNPMGDFELGASKIANGFALTGGDFAFEAYEIISEDNGDGTFSEATGKLLIATNTADGAIAFDKVSIDRDDIGKERTYRISEVKGNVSGITYDTSTWIASVSFIDDGAGHLSADISYADANDETIIADLPAFVNTKGMIALPLSGKIGIFGLAGIIGILLFCLGFYTMYPRCRKTAESKKKDACG